jgi:hypothetical protein
MSSLAAAVYTLLILQAAATGCLIALLAEVAIILRRVSRAASTIVAASKRDTRAATNATKRSAFNLRGM